ncbi:hypothetical protein PI124_g20111 [Phytophthora idaei]|nr:hypothetical protein PI125_g21406 [Phytophthora idaei]KAG3234841.1 hypothetical protein PI124_g20111 [Phytophthora idaei]
MSEPRPQVEERPAAVRHIAYGPLNILVILNSRLTNLEAAQPPADSVVAALHADLAATRLTNLAAAHPPADSVMVVLLVDALGKQLVHLVVSMYSDSTARRLGGIDLARELNGVAGHYDGAGVQL